ncbi:MAG: hypothetical protein M1823_001730 [Watsoniomyces obsoletus]|nr:MAG: hypothetical protein M1823_001730 [Watsoniomyces obsoletus]
MTSNMLQPTYVGYIAEINDALLVLEACLSAKLRHLPRFPLKQELPHVVQSGNIFVYEKIATGTGEWDDRRGWEFCRHEYGLRVEQERSTSDALMKTSGSIVLEGVCHYIVSYYKEEDVQRGTLKTPSQDPDLQKLKLRPGLASQKVEKAPVDSSSF